MESLRQGAKEMLATEIPFEVSAQMTTIDIPDPAWLSTAPIAHSLVFCP
jgi:hypothetical protein